MFEKEKGMKNRLPFQRMSLKPQQPEPASSATKVTGIVD